MKENFIDIASYQSWMKKEDYINLKNKGIDGAIIKISESTNYINPYWINQKNICNEVFNFVHYYHFARFSTISEAELEASFFVEQAKNNKIPKNTILFCDAEISSMNTENVLAFLKVIKKSGYKAGFYTYDGMMNQFDYNKIKEVSDFEWIANYPTMQAQDIFPVANTLKSNADAWQYTSNLFGQHLDNSIVIKNNNILHFNDEKKETEKNKVQKKYDTNFETTNIKTNKTSNSKKNKTNTVKDKEKELKQEIQVNDYQAEKIDDCMLASLSLLLLAIICYIFLKK